MQKSVHVVENFKRTYSHQPTRHHYLRHDRSPITRTIWKWMQEMTYAIVLLRNLEECNTFRESVWNFRGQASVRAESQTRQNVCPRRGTWRFAVASSVVGGGSTSVRFPLSGKGNFLIRSFTRSIHLGSAHRCLERCLYREVELAHRMITMALEGIVVDYKLGIRHCAMSCDPELIPVHDVRGFRCTCHGSWDEIHPITGS